MAVNISSLAYALRKVSEASSHPLDHGHAMEITAAALGYGSLAAYKAGIASGDECADLAEAGHLVLDGQAIIDRAVQLSHMAPSLTRLEMVLNAFDGCLPRARRFRSESDLFDEIVSVIVRKTVNDEEIMRVMASTKSGAADEIYLPFEFSLSELPPPGSTVQMEIEGRVTMGPGLGGSDTASKIGIAALLTLERVGRRAIKAPDYCVLNAKLDDDS